VNQNDWDKISDTHPSVNSRIDRLLGEQKPIWNRLSIPILEVLTSKLFRNEFLYQFIQDLNDDSRKYPVLLRPLVIFIELFKILILRCRHRN
jgi:hypothetical protein